MTDERIALIDCWVAAGGGPTAELLEILDAHMQSPEVVERVARVLYAMDEDVRAHSYYLKRARVVIAALRGGAE